MFDTLKELGFQVEIHSHAEAILSVDFPEAVLQLEEAVGSLSIPIEEIIGSGGGETQGTQRLRRSLAALGWKKMNFIVEKTINGQRREAISHEIDHVKQFDKGIVALEIEWNNKDPFFDRDLENFKRLHADGAISVGVIVTRGTTMQDNMKELVQRFAYERGLNSNDAVEEFGMARTKRQRTAVENRVSASGCSFEEAWASLFVADKYGAATTHWSKLEARVHRGVGNPCPLVLIGLPSSIVRFDQNIDLEDIAEEENALIRDGIAPES
ncbi:BglII/BstYI family type II restriction endonuclease [Ochrobactrum teleogrylli]|uniref:Restriction endonuclease n=1 Tax=Ochrobactrum teleogrylli TaxID=2479765 RepID=A0ABY2Y8X2_9HYPH|nr:MULTISPECIES: BglII/BstYI family type II restriction endonuclease [Brucella]TNV18384.1 restriction endonuclease [[Ochrobactrum] teleogrylli]